jgi:ferredoxin-NADP reductase
MIFYTLYPMDNIVKILETKEVTHDTKQFRLEKPKGYHFLPGQATDLSINKPEWKDNKHPFTFTGLNDDPFLQFTIKRYPDHHGVTDQLHRLKPGDELIVRDVWGAIEYRGPGYFLAGGAGITPFLAIFRQLHKDNQVKGNTLFFSNKTADDIIEHDELLAILGVRVTFLLTRESASGSWLRGHIDENFLKDQVSNFRQPFYICGPDDMVGKLTAMLKEMHAKAESLIFEQ